MYSTIPHVFTAVQKGCPLSVENEISLQANRLRWARAAADEEGGCAPPWAAAAGSRERSPPSRRSPRRGTGRHLPLAARGLRLARRRLPASPRPAASNAAGSPAGLHSRRGSRGPPLWTSRPAELPLVPGAPDPEKLPETPRGRARRPPRPPAPRRPGPRSPTPGKPRQSSVRRGSRRRPPTGGGPEKGARTPGNPAGGPRPCLGPPRSRAGAESSPYLPAF